MDNEPMGPVEHGAAPFLTIIGEVLRHLGAGRNNIGNRKWFIIVAEVGAPSVICAKEKPLRNFSDKPNEHSVIFAEGGRLDGGPGSPSRIQTTLLQAGDRAPCNNPVGLLLGQYPQIPLPLAEQMIGAVARISHLDDVVLPKLALDRKAPEMSGRVLNIRG